MIRILVSRAVDTLSQIPVNYIEASGLSTDDKPTAGVCTGSLFMEADTGDIYVFDETSSGTWSKIGG